MKFFSVRTFVVLAIVLIVVGILASMFFRQGDEDERRTAAVAKGTVVQDVTFTGRLQSHNEAHLGFAVSGPVVDVAVEEGSIVDEGQVLAQIDARDASLSFSKAVADREAARAQTLISWDKAKADEENTKQENSQQIEAQKQLVRDKKAELDQARSAWETRVDDEGEDSYLAKIAYSTYLTAKSSYNGAQETLKTLQKTVTASNQSAYEASQLAREQHLATVQASGGVSGLSSLAALESRARVLLSQHTLTAPFAGTITGVNLEVGEFATAGLDVVRLETVNQLEISSNVTETDAFKISKGMTSTVSLDALPSTEEWQATVIYVAPSAVIVEGVPVYEIRLSLDEADARLKPGLTANVDVHTDREDNVLMIPRRSVNSRGSSQFVIVVGEDGYEAERYVTTGLIGSDGTIEITGGLHEGEVVLISRQASSP